MTKSEKTLQERFKKLRLAVAKYMVSEGCSCCRSDNHEENRKKVGDLLSWPRYSDNSGYDYFSVVKEAESTQRKKKHND